MTAPPKHRPLSRCSSRALEWPIRRLQPTSAQLVTIADICRRLDGMPLAIELASARVRLLGIDGLQARLDERFNVLTGGTRSVLRRHQTLRATLEWSHQLLSAEERAVFRRLGVFVGGFSQVGAGRRRRRTPRQVDCAGSARPPCRQVVGGCRRGEAPRYRLLENRRVRSHLSSSLQQGKRHSYCAEYMPMQCLSLRSTSRPGIGGGAKKTRRATTPSSTTCVPPSIGLPRQRTLVGSRARCLPQLAAVVEL